MNTEKIKTYNKNWKEYDEWFETHQAIYQSEIKALRKIVPSGQGLEIGVGTGRFSSPFSVQYGLDLSFNMLKIAKQKNIKVIQGIGENLPFKNDSFNFILIVLTLWLIDDSFCFLKEAVRTLKKNGVLIIGIINRKSSWGRFYEQKATKSKFYKAGHFFSAEEIIQILKNIKVEFKEAWQTLFQSPPDIREIEKPIKGSREGGFVVLKAIK